MIGAVTAKPNLVLPEEKKNQLYSILRQFDALVVSEDMGSACFASDSDLKGISFVSVGPIEEKSYPLRFEELWCSADGSLVLSSPVLPGGEVKANVPGHYFYYKGYGDLEALRRAMADPERSVYNVEEVWAP